MAILKMKKFHLLVLNSEREELLRELQIFRNIQFEDIFNREDLNDKRLEKFKRSSIEKELVKYDQTLNRVNSIIEFVTKYSSPISGIKDVMKGLPNYTFEELENKVNSTEYKKKYEAIRKLKDELEIVESDLSKKRELIEELRPLSNLDVDFERMKKVKKFNAIVGEVSWKLVDEFRKNISKLENTYYEEISSYKKEYFFFVISNKKYASKLDEVFRESNFNRIHLDIDRTPSEQIKLLEKEIEELYKRKSEIIKEAGSKKEIIDEFKLQYEYIGNLKVRLLANQKILNSERSSYINGYCPEFEVERLKKTIEKVCNEEYLLEFSEVEKDDSDVPIMLKNSKFIRVFESITSTYALPKYNEIDPTPLYAPIYALFFGMMSADVGYGTVLIILTTLGLHLCNFSSSIKKTVKFFQLLGISTAIWGFLYGSYFGASINGVWRLFDMSTQFMTVLSLSVIMGGAHLFYGLGIKAYMEIRDGRYMNVLFDVVSWYITLISIIVLLLTLVGTVPDRFRSLSMETMCLGIILLIIAGARSVQGNIIQKLVVGLYNVYGISNYIGDFVSYSRLMALGMAGGYIAFSVNMIAGMLWGKSIIGSVAAIFILIFFHAFNLFLSCLGAYVHALRLIYVEFFGKFYEGGGKAFKVFRNQAKYVNLDRQFED